jgi:hypothetical protein
LADLSDTFLSAIISKVGTKSFPRQNCTFLVLLEHSWLPQSHTLKSEMCFFEV